MSGEFADLEITVVSETTTNANNHVGKVKDKTEDVSKSNDIDQDQLLFTQFMTVASHGTEFLLIDNHGNPIRSMVQVSTDASELATKLGFFELSADVLVLDGPQSRPFKKVQHIVPEKLCFSLVNAYDSKSVNFIAKDEKVKLAWMFGFKQLCGATDKFTTFQKEFTQFCQNEKIRLSQISHDDMPNIKDQFEKHKVSKKSTRQSLRRKKLYKKPQNHRQSILGDIADLLMGKPKLNNLASKPQTDTNKSSRKSRSRSPSKKKMDGFGSSTESSKPKDSEPIGTTIAKSMKKRVTDIKERVSITMDKVNDKLYHNNSKKLEKYSTLSIKEDEDKSERHILRDHTDDDNNNNNNNNKNGNYNNDDIANTSNNDNKKNSNDNFEIGDAIDEMDNDTEPSYDQDEDETKGNTQNGTEEEENETDRVWGKFNDENSEMVIHTAAVV